MKAHEIIKGLEEGIYKAGDRFTSRGWGLLVDKDLSLFDENQSEELVVDADFINCNWEEVKQPYTFEEAKQICSEPDEDSEVVFVSEYNEEMYYSLDSVRIKPSEGTPVKLDCKWYKQ